MTDFRKRFDVLVAGAGVAGVAASLAAARAGLRTALVEKTTLPGGLATSGLIIAYLPLCDGLGNQVTFGLPEELLHASIRYGPGEIPEGWSSSEKKYGRSRFGATFCAASFVLAMDELLADAGVDLWLDTLVCGADVEGDRLTGVEVENKSGRGLLLADCFIDATGDADVAHRAGASMAEQDNWLSMWAMGASLEVAREAVEQGTGDPLNHGVRLGASNTGEGHPEGMRKFHGTDGRDVTEFVLEGRRLLREHYREKQRRVGRRNAFPIALPSMAQFHTTRRIDGQRTLREGEHGTRRPDSVGLIANWWRPGEVWEVPYAALLPRGVRGLLAAGRCISAAGEAWEVTRVIQAAAHTGQIAGVAATVAVREGTTPDALRVGDLQQELAQRGIPYRYDAESGAYVP